jgi:glycosyltransferase involved in cell wall biosynthesis
LSEIRDADAFADSLIEVDEQRERALELADQSKAFYRAHFEEERFIERVGSALKRADELVSTATAFSQKGAIGEAKRKGMLRVGVYLADQNPQLSRSLGISRMTNVVMEEMARRTGVELTGLTSRSSIQMPEGSKSVMVPWSTNGRTSRVLTDHLHPLMRLKTSPDLWYFPKGFLPRVSVLDAPMVVTIHDTIIQHYSDYYPKWRMDVEYHYWASILKNTLRRAKAILTVSESAKGQIVDFMERHEIPPKEIIVTYEPCLYEELPQPEEPAKADYVLHLSSREPHKRTSWLIDLWARAHAEGRKLPRLHVVGKLPYDVIGIAERSPAVVRLPFLDDDALVSQFTAARALLLPSEIEGFGLPAIEAYYLGTPVCYVTGTSVEEVLAPATGKGGFHYDDEGSIFRALDEVMGLSAGEVRECGLKLRREYAADRVVDKILEVFKQVGGKG